MPDPKEFEHGAVIEERVVYCASGIDTVVRFGTGATFFFRPLELRRVTVHLYSDGSIRCYESTPRDGVHLAEGETIGFRTDHCDARATFYPGVEDIDHSCDLPEGHAGLHHDPDLGEWKSADHG